MLQNNLLLKLFLLLLVVNLIINKREGHNGKIDKPGHKKLLYNWFYNDRKAFIKQKKIHKKNTKKGHKWKNMNNIIMS